MKLLTLFIITRYRILQRRNMALLRDVGIAESSIKKYLVADPQEPMTGDKIRPRQIKSSHYVLNLPEPVSDPKLVIASEDCLKLLNIDKLEANTAEFANVFGGSLVLPGLGTPYTTTYGCHSFGHYFGQMGDGRAVTIGEMLGTECRREIAAGDPALEDMVHYSSHIQELQLKGGGRSPFSRGFDGRAVLRSCTREFLVSEALHHLGVPTSRALTIISTGETVNRAWYSAGSGTNPYAQRFSEATGAAPSNMPKFPPDRMFAEPGAVLCRVARSFLRFGHLEIFGLGKEYQNLIKMADYVCFKEYPELLAIGPNAASAAGQTSVEVGPCDELSKVRLPSSLPPGTPLRYVSLYRKVVHRSAYLVAQWMRVGYVHGNMNSDNCLLSGFGVDYGPFGWMEGYNRNYQPFTTDVSGDFRYCNQPNAMQLNCIVLGEAAFTELVLHTAKSKHDAECERFLEEIKTIGEAEFEGEFQRHYDEVKRTKLGLLSFASGDLDRAKEGPFADAPMISDSLLWGSLENLMHRQGADFTILFREMAKAADLSAEFSTSTADAEANRRVAARALEKLRPAMYDTKFALTEDCDWLDWMEHYLFRIRCEGQDPEERRRTQNRANPKYILRNWMSILAYEAAIKGDRSVLEELHYLLQRPYEDQSMALQSKWYSKTPTWAKNLPGCTFLSCSS